MSGSQILSAEVSLQTLQELSNFQMGAFLVEQAGLLAPLHGATAGQLYTAMGLMVQEFKAKLSSPILTGSNVLANLLSLLQVLFALLACAYIA